MKVVIFVAGSAIFVGVCSVRGYDLTEYFVLRVFDINSLLNSAILHQILAILREILFNKVICVIWTIEMCLYD